jgi:hypothetical protein
MNGHALAKIRSLVATLTTIMKCARYKDPATVEEARTMLALVAGIAEETLAEEADTPTVMAGTKLAQPWLVQ